MSKRNKKLKFQNIWLMTTDEYNVCPPILFSHFLKKEKNLNTFLNQIFANKKKWLRAIRLYVVFENNAEN